MRSKVAWVTGASSGLGKAIAEDLARQGHTVFASARREDRLEAMRSRRVHPVPLDVTDRTSIEAARDLIVAAEARIDLLVNNAGYGLYGPLEGVSEQQARDLFDVNVFGLAEMTRAVLPVMRGQRSGTIINMSSAAGRAAVPMIGWYAASKYAIEALSDALRLEVRPFGIHVVLVEPGAIRTEFHDVAMNAFDASEFPHDYDGWVRAFRRRSPSGWMPTRGPAAVNRVVRRIVRSARPRARYVVGAEMRFVLFLKACLGDRWVDAVLYRQVRREMARASEGAGHDPTGSPPRPNRN